MRIIISGSLAYDRIMVFDGRFGEHIMPDKAHMLNVCFAVNDMQEKLGGTAGNISYGLSQLGEPSYIWANLGRDGANYMEVLHIRGINTDGVQILDNAYTPGAFIVTDMSDNQITVFNSGAMKYPSRYAWEQTQDGRCLFIIAPGNLTDMAELPRALRQKGLPFIFDPGQSLTAWHDYDLGEALSGAKLLICNDYEMEIISNVTGWALPQILDKVEAAVVTKGEKGSVLHLPGQQIKIPAIPPDSVVDPTGSGDAYRAGLLKGLALGLDLAQACLWGAALASYCVSGLGTQEYTVDLVDFEKRVAWGQDKLR